MKLTKVTIQGERGSNSHMAARGIVAEAEILPCSTSAEALDQVLEGQAEGAVLPIENSLHGSIVDHYDLLLSRRVRMVREFSLRIEHHLIAARGVVLADVRRVLSHPVALSQCRRWLAEHSEIDAVSFYDTAGAVKHAVDGNLRDTAGIAPALAVALYGADLLVSNVEDHRENYTRFHLIVPEVELPRWRVEQAAANKMSVVFALEHRPGTLVAALARIAAAGADLTKIESRPVPGRAWEYLFFVDLRFEQPAVADDVLSGLGGCCRTVRELGRYYQAALL